MYEPQPEVLSAAIPTLRLAGAITVTAGVYQSYQSIQEGQLLTVLRDEGLEIGSR
jgi:hypothetical protein